jgi:hypothetical protein
MKNLKFFGVIPAAILAGVFLFTSCEQATDTEYITHNVPTPQGADVLAANADDLATYLDEDSDYQVIAVTSDISDAGEDLVVPATKTLLLYASLTPNGTSGLTIEGKVIVSAGGTLVAADGTPVTIAAGGSLEVTTNGTLSVENLTEGLDADDESAVVFKGGNLAVATLADAAGITTALGYIGSQGELTVTSLTAAKLSDIVAAVGSAEVTITTLATQTDEAAGVTSITIPSNLTIGAVTTGALASTVTTLTVNGSYTPKDDDTLANLTTLTVNGTLSAAAATLDALTDLTVNGELTSIGTGASEGIEVTVGAEGEATLATVAKLLAGSTVAAGGTLTATAVTAFDTGASLAVYAGSIVNGITLPGATTISALAADAITIGDLTVSGPTVALGDGKAITIGTGKTLTIETTVTTVTGSTVIKTAGTGVIFRDGVTYTTDGSGVEGSAIVAAVGALGADAAILANNESYNLNATFGADVTGVGSTTVSSTSATAVKGGADGSTGDDLELSGNTDFASAVTATGDAVTGTDADVIKAATYTLTIDSETLKIADGGYAGSNAKNGVITFTGVKLKSSGLIGPALPDFNVGIITARE